MQEFYLSGGFEKYEIEQIHRTALSILKKSGLLIPNSTVLECLQGRRGIKIEDSIVKFEDDLVSEILNDLVISSQNKEEILKEKRELKCTVGGLSLRYSDLYNDKIRDAQSPDLVDMVKLADSFGLSGVNPLTPVDLAPHIKEVAIHKLCIENGQDIGCGIMNSADQAEFIYDMNEVVGRKTSFSLWTISPLQLGNDSLEMCIRLGKKNNIQVRVTNMPMLGATSSVRLGEAFCQSIAELLGALTVAFFLVGKEKIDFRLHTLIYPFDMRLGNCIYGSPESNLMDLLSMQISDFYGLPKGPVRGYKSLGKGHDIESAVERAVGVFAAALNGWTEFFAAGRTCNDEVFSPIQLVIDIEILHYVQRFMDSYGLGNISDTDALISKIEEARNGTKTFLEQEETVQQVYADNYWYPELFNYERLDSWLLGGAIPITERAKEIAKVRLQNHYFERGKEEQKEINRIYQKALHHLH